MTLSPRQKKWIKGFLILLGIRLVVGLLLYYIIEYRFREIIRVIVHRESNGKYDFDADDIDFSIWKKNIRLKNAAVMATDTSNAVTRYQVKIPEVYLAISSWKALIFHRQIYVDSLSIQLPDVQTIAASRAARKSSVSLQASEIFKVMRNTLGRLHVRRLNLHNGAFSYTSSPGPAFNSNKINLSASNFGTQDSTDQRFLFADDIDLSITDQRWLMSGGLKEIRFKKLHFSSSNQYFEADSCAIITAPVNGKPGVSLTVDKLLFKGHDLAAIYERDELLLDTIICHHPVVTLSPRGKRERNRPDTTSFVKQSIQRMFKGINLKYVDVREGQVRLDYDSTRAASYATERTSLKIYNLNIQHETRPHITTDSIDLQLKGVSFYTPDSMYKLTIDEFALNRKDIVFSHAVFAPTDKNHQAKALSFTAPHLRLNNFSLEDLIMSRLRADEAILESPQIKFYTNNRSRKSVDSTLDVSSLYETLNGVSELIQVHRFDITKGRVEYLPLARVREKAVIANINAKILLNQLLRSDSLVNIKQSILQLDIDRIGVVLPKLALQIGDLRINGLTGVTFINSLDADLGENIHLRGQQLAWRNLDWDAFQQENNIVADSIYIKQLAIDLGRTATRNKKKAMPVIRLRKARLEQLSFDGVIAANTQLQFDVRHLYVDALSSQNQYLLWDRARGNISNIRFQGENAGITARQLILDTRAENILSDMRFRSDNMTMLLPRLSFHGDLRSTGARRLQIVDMHAQSPVIDLNSGPSNGKHKDKPLHIPVDLLLDRARISAGQLHFHGRDSLELQSLVNIELRKLSADRNAKHALQYGSLTIDLGTLQLQGHEMTADAGNTMIRLSNGVMQRDKSLQTDISATWQQAQFRLDKADSTALNVANLSGEINYPGFQHLPGKPVNWAAFLDKTNFSTGPVNWHNRERHARVEDVRWTKHGEVLEIDSLTMAPHMEKAAYVAAQAYQVPYLALQTHHLQLAGLRERDSIWQVRRVTADGVLLTTAKDKRKPMPAGAHKPMLSGLFGNMKFPFHADSMLVRDALVLTEETSPKTKMTSHIPVEHINVLARNVGSRRPAGQDSLILEAQLQLFNNEVRKLYYNESYSDSLAGFTMQVAVAPMHLPHLTKMTTPLAGIGVSRGEADTLYYQVHGNKYAAVGTMNFVYDKLRIRMLALPDTSKNNLVLRLKNWAANSLVLRKHNEKPVFIFIDRDPDKMFLNYWIKSTLRGLMASAGLKNNKKAFFRWARKNEEYKLPQ